MCVLGKDRIAELVERYRIVHPFDSRLLDGDGYVITVREDVELNYLEHRNIVSNEIIFTPPDIVALLTAKSRYGRLGLSFLNAAKIHSGWVGRVVLECVNLSNDRKPIIVRKGEPFMHVVFMTRQGGPSPYVGDFMFQFMTEEEINGYIPVMRKLMPDFDRLREIWSRGPRTRGT